MQIYLTADFFFEPDKTFWICLQPHIKIAAQADLDAFIQSLGKSTNFQYTLWRHDADNTGLVPVPFASDADLYLKLIGAAAGFDERSNLRTQAVQLDAAGWLEFESANRDEDETLNRSGNAASQYVISPGPFAQAYNTSLQTAWANTVQQAQTDNTIDPVNHMCQMLTAAFWGGTRRRLPASASATSLDKISIMPLQEIVPSAQGVPPFVGIITNLHSLAGLMFRVGSRDDAASLNTVTDLELDIDDGSGAKQVLKFSDLSWAKPTVTTFFSSLSSALPQTGETAVWFAEFGKRVYVSDGASTFAPQQIGGQLWFRRKQDDAWTPQHPLSNNLRSLVVRFSGNANLPLPPQLSLALYDSFDVVFTKFGDARQGPDGSLLQLRPRLDERTSFYSEVARQLAADPNWFAGPGRPRFFDRDGNEKTFAFVGSYSLPWGLDAQTILFYGQAMDPSDALMLFSRSGPQALALKGDEPATDPFGLRYELDLPAGLGNFSFDTLVNPQPAATDAAMIVAANFAGQFHFDLAQSVSNIEGNLEVQYPAPIDPKDQNSIDANQEYLHDLLNYNSLNVVAKYPGSANLVHLNPKTELFPVYSVRPADQTDEPKDHYSAYFHFRYTDPITPVTATDTANPPRFFRDLNGRLGGNVELGFNIEHTYGPTIDLSATGSVTSYVNFAPILPNELTLNGNAAKKASPDDQHFCTVSLVQGQDADTLSLSFRPLWLSAAWTADPDLAPFSTAAWRSVAEMANSGKIMITGKFLSFNFRKALDDSTDDVLAQGFAPVPNFANWQADVTATLAPVMATWLSNGQMGVSSFDGIAISSLGGVRVGASCTIIEFDLTLWRKGSVLPPDAASLTFVRPSAVFATSPQGQSMDIVPKVEVNDAYAVWLAGLTSRTAPITPLLTASDQQYALDLRKLLGASDQEAGAWIPPHALMSPAGQAIPSVCPLAFLPLAINTQLGDATYQTVSNYLWALDVVLRGAVLESANMRAAHWKAYFDTLQSRAGDLTNLFSKMLLLVKPVPNPAAKDQNGNVLLDGEVLSSTNDLSNTATPEYAALKQWLQSEIGAAPAIFGDSKAFLYTRLKGNGADGLTPQEFARLNFTKLLTREESGFGSQAAWGSQSATDTDRALVWESLRHLKDRPGFGFVETLDALRYRDDFQVQEFSLSSMEGLVEALRSPNPGAAESAPINLVNGQVHLPIGPKPPGDTNATVRLPSRQPVTAPVYHFTGQLQFSEDLSFDTLASGPLLRDPFLSGRVQPLQGGDTTSPIACVVGTPAAPIDRTKLFADQYILSSVFSIRGDEEATTQWNQAFANDQFHIRIDQLAQPSAPSGTPVDAFISSLTAAISPDALTGLHGNVLQSNYVQFFTGALQAPDTPSGTIAEAIALPYLEIAAASTSVTLKFKNADGTPLAGFEAYLFKTGVASAGCAAPPSGSSMILLINRQASAWTSSWACIQQTRNLLDSASQVHFANEFATVAPLAGPQYGVQPIVTRDFSSIAPVKLSRQTYTTTDLVKLLLFPTLLNPTVTGNQWRNFDLSVTLHARQMVTQWTVYVDETGNLEPDMSLADHSWLAEKSFVSRIQTPDFDVPRDWLDPNIDDYFVDFHWSSGSNLAFFRIRVPVTVQ